MSEVSDRVVNVTRDVTAKGQGIGLQAHFRLQGSRMLFASLLQCDAKRLTGFESSVLVMRKVVCGRRLQS